MSLPLPSREGERVTKGILALGSSYSPGLPIRSSETGRMNRRGSSSCEQWPIWVSSPNTVAGPRWISTIFPLRPRASLARKRREYDAIQLSMCQWKYAGCCIPLVTLLAVIASGAPRATWQSAERRKAAPGSCRYRCPKANGMRLRSLFRAKRGISFAPRNDPLGSRVTENV